MATTHYSFDITIWKQDWFIHLMEAFPEDFGLYFYIRDNCNHGVWRATMKDYQIKTAGRRIDIFKFAEACNKIQNRLVWYPEKGVWFLPYYWQEVHGRQHVYGKDGTAYIFHKDGVIPGKKACALCRGMVQHLYRNGIPISDVIGAANSNDILFDDLAEPTLRGKIKTPDVSQLSQSDQDLNSINTHEPGTSLLPHPVLGQRPPETTDLSQNGHAAKTMEFKVPGSYQPVVNYPYDGSPKSQRIRAWLEKCDWNRILYNTKVRSAPTLKWAIETFASWYFRTGPSDEVKTVTEMSTFFYNWLMRNEQHIPPDNGSAEGQDYNSIEGMK